jgi:hypothetical protein
MIIYLNNLYKNNKSKVNNILSFMEYTTINHLKKSLAIYYDPNA